MSTPLNIFDITRNYVLSCFKDEAQMRHFDRTVYWLKQLNPNVGEYLLVAAIGHDIARSLIINDSPVYSPNSVLDKDYLKEHQETGATILGEFLKTQNCDQDFINKVQNAVSKHEVGGDDDQNLLKDADSISFLENGSDIYESFIKRFGAKETKNKFDWMYNRITSKTAKQIAKPFYEEILNLIN